MEGNDSINMRNWDFFEPPASTALKSHLDLQLMSTMAEKPLLDGDRDSYAHNHHHHHHHYLTQQIHPVVMASTNGGPYHHHRVGGISGSPISMDYMRETWFNQREKYLNVFPTNQNHHSQINYGMLPEAPLTHSVQMIQQSSLVKIENISSPEAENLEEREGGGPVKKRAAVKAPKSPKAKKPKAPKVPKEESTRSVHRARTPKRSAEVIINGIIMDISGIPIPVCTCTGAAQQCYRWGAGGWQSACCTTSMSMYPLPMSAKRRSARIAGRKMSLGAFRKVLEKLASEGYNFSNPIDLRNHWAKHGTNKFVIIR